MEQHRTIDRQAIRELVQRNHEELVGAIGRGENHYQLSLDQNDRIENEYTVGMTQDEKARFYEIFAQETEAMASQVNLDTQRLQEKIDTSNETAENVGKLIGGIIVFIVVLFFLNAIF